MSADDSPDAYDSLLERYERATYIGDAAGVLSWDQEVVMPEGGTVVENFVVRREVSKSESPTYRGIDEGD